MSAVGPEIRVTSAPRRSGRGGHRLAHLAGGAVRDVAHRVDRLAGRTRGHEQALAGQVAPRGEHALERLHDGVHLGQAPAPGEAGGERARVGLEHGDPALAEGARRWRSPRRDPTCRRPSRGPSAPDTARPAAAWSGSRRRCRARPGQEVGGGRRDHEGVGALGQGHVLDRLRALRIEEIGEHRAAGERPEGEGADELAPRARSVTTVTRAPSARELAQQVDRLEGGDAAGDAEDQVLSWRLIGCCCLSCCRSLCRSCSRSASVSCCGLLKSLSLSAAGA